MGYPSVNVLSAAISHATRVEVLGMLLNASSSSTSAYFRDSNTATLTGAAQMSAITENNP